MSRFRTLKLAMTTLKVSRLYRYPVKSLPGIAVDEMPLDDFGPANDRRWMIIDAEGRFVTQRTEPRLALAEVYESGGGELALGLPDGAHSALRPGSERQAVQIWHDRVEAVLAAGDASASLSRWLGQELYLVYMPDNTVRPADPGYVVGERRVSFADGFPFLVANAASLQQVETWSQEAWSMQRFRPNIVVSGADAFAEDQWRWLRVGGAVLECVKPCSRCLITTVDPATGVFDSRKEPLRTLGRHRRSSSGVIFGQNAVHWRGANIRVGDNVEILDGCPL